MHHRVIVRALPGLRLCVSAGWRDSIPADDIVFVNDVTRNRAFFANISQAAVIARGCERPIQDPALACLT
jgi:hypothetical protein